jgi:conjugal transfer pilus assembly protein TraE
MNYKKYLSKFDKIQASNKVLTLFVFIIGGLVVINIFVTISIATNEKTVLVPMGLNAKAEISENKADLQYLRQSARYVLGLLLNYSPATVKPQYEELLLVYDSESYPAARTRLFNLADAVKTSQISSIFMPQTFSVDQSNSWLKVQGARKIYKDDRTSTNTMETYQIFYKIKGSTFYVSDVKEVERI